MAGIRIEGNTSGNVAGVDSGSNLQAALSNTPAYVGGVRIVSECDAGTVTGVPKLLYPRTSSEFRLRVGLDTPMFYDSFNATAQNTSVWLHYFSTMTVTQGGGFVLFNANSSASLNNCCSLQTWRTFVLIGQATVTLEFTGNITASPKANQVFEAGFFRPAATPSTAPTDGIFWRIDYSGTAQRLRGVCVFNGAAEVITEMVTPSSTLAVDTNSTYLITVDAREVNWWINDILVGTTTTPSAESALFLGTGLPIGMQQRNSGAVGASPMQVKIANCMVTYDDTHTSKPWQHQMAGMDLMASQGQNGGTMGSTVVGMANNSAPAATALTNTTFAVGAGLGGQFNVLPTLAAGTDGILCAYLNPVGGINQTPRNLYITGVNIQGVVTTALTGGPVIYAYALCYGGSSPTGAGSLATPEVASFAAPATTTGKAYRRIPLGYESYIAAAAVGAVSGKGVQMTFACPILVAPGEYATISAKNLGTVTTLGSITIMVSFNGYWE